MQRNTGGSLQQAQMKLLPFCANLLIQRHAVTSHPACCCIVVLPSRCLSSLTPPMPGCNSLIHPHTSSYTLLRLTSCSCHDEDPLASLGLRKLQRLPCCEAHQRHAPCCGHIHPLGQLCHPSLISNYILAVRACWPARRGQDTGQGYRARADPGRAAVQHTSNTGKSCKMVQSRGFQLAALECRHIRSACPLPCDL
jgi:hypothetical protein